MASKFKTLFPRICSVVGMIHADALPGTPRYKGSIQKIIDKACKEAEVYVKYNLDGIILENMHDIPYVQASKIGPEIIATLAKVAAEIKTLVPTTIPCGLQVLACGNMEALAIAQACSFNFIRAEGFVFSHIADEGFTDANAGTLLRYRKNIEADDVLVFADIKKKHSSHAITQDISLVETAKAAEYFLADALIITGTTTGDPADTDDLSHVKKNTSLPVLIGSGVTKTNLYQYLNADAVIIGSHFKKDGKWSNELDESRIKLFMEEITLLRNQYINNLGAYSWGKNKII